MKSGSHIQYPYAGYGCMEYFESYLAKYVGNIYLLVGNSPKDGEGWIVSAFLSENTAGEEVKRYNEKAQALEAAGGGRHFDSEYVPGTTYTIETVEINDPSYLLRLFGPMPMGGMIR